jgi:hypothetical protein
MKKLGLGIQELSQFKEKNLIYVDKTDIIHKLIEDGKYYFLSRPRRFGKSLLINTIYELFSGNKALFQECSIYKKWNWEEKYPVIKISFSEVDYRKKGLEDALELTLLQQAQTHGIEFKTSGYSTRFLELIKNLGSETPVAILIDEYDKPIIDYLEKSEFEQAQQNREILKTFYAGIKDQDKYICFLFITGVSKFSKVSIFSDLNHLTDITVNDKCATIAGYTEEEIKKYYKDYLGPVAKKLDISHTELLEKIKEWYDGYSWDGINFLYNPYSILNLFYAEVFKNYWFETGSPTFLIKRLKAEDKKIHASINKAVKESAFNKYDIENINITAIMFQTGYLTIKKVDRSEGTYLLDYPNKEVRDSFLDFAVEHYANSSTDEMTYIVETLTEALENKDIKSFFTALHSLYSSITVKQLEKVKEYEGFYHSIIYIVLKILGIQINCEIQSNFGTTDAVIKTDDYIYVIEFKMGKAALALEQIKKKKYFEPYISDKRQVLIVGLGFDKTKRNLEDFVVEELKS